MDFSSNHYWWVTKRLIKGLLANPEGWPKDSPLWSSTISSYRVIPRCNRYLTPRYRQLVIEMAASKRVATSGRGEKWRRF
jgi:hypothetical protein